MMCWSRFRMKDARINHLVAFFQHSERAIIERARWVKTFNVLHDLTVSVFFNHMYNLQCIVFWPRIQPCFLSCKLAVYCSLYSLLLFFSLLPLHSPSCSVVHAFECLQAKCIIWSLTFRINPFWSSKNNG